MHTGYKQCSNTNRLKLVCKSFTYMKHLKTETLQNRIHKYINETLNNVIIINICTYYYENCSHNPSSHKLIEYSGVII